MIPVHKKSQVMVQNKEAVTTGLAKGSMGKPFFNIDVASETHSNLEAYALLTTLMETGGIIQSGSLRPPLGIYNVSINRVCDKIIRCCTRLEQIFHSSADPHQNRGVVQELVDYIELAIYAAAEHVDDIQSIVSAFSGSGVAKKHRKIFNKNFKAHRRFVSAIANAIKHQQSRIRIFSTKFQFSTVGGWLHGYFIEGVENGVVGPNGIFHSQQQVFSAITLPWEILTFVLNSSLELSQFLRAVTNPGGGAAVHCESFNKAVIAAARLPNYAFGDEHPFTRCSLRLTNVNLRKELFDSGLFGSILRGWPKGAAPIFSSCLHSYEGDGVSKTFKMVSPKQVKFHLWD